MTRYVVRAIAGLVSFALVASCAGTPPNTGTSPPPPTLALPTLPPATPTIDAECPGRDLADPPWVCRKFPATPAAATMRYDLPPWMRRPDAQILMGVSDWLDGVFQLSFFGAEPSERFDLLLPEDVTGYLWLGANHFALLSNDGRALSSVSLLNGEVVEYDVTQKAVSYLSDDFYDDAPRALLPLGQFSNQDTFFLVAALDRDEFSRNGRYFASTGDFQDGYPITVTDLTTGTAIVLSSFANGLWNGWYSWSQETPTHLDVAQFKLSPETSELVGDRMTTYDVTTGRVLAFTLDSAPQNDLPPCVSDQDTDQAICLPEIEQAHLTGQHEAEGIGEITLAKDKKRVFYTYYYRDPSIEGYYSGNFCMLALDTKAIVCPTDGIPEMTGNTITEYHISPDGEHVILHMECRSVGEDASCAPTNALMSLDGSGFRLLVNPELVARQMRGEVNFILDNYESASAYVWRPAP